MLSHWCNFPMMGVGWLTCYGNSNPFTQLTVFLRLLLSVLLNFVQRFYLIGNHLIDLPKLHYLEISCNHSTCKDGCCESEGAEPLQWVGVVCPTPKKEKFAISYIIMGVPCYVISGTECSSRACMHKWCPVISKRWWPFYLTALYSNGGWNKPCASLKKGNHLHTQQWWNRVRVRIWCGFSHDERASMIKWKWNRKSFLMSLTPCIIIIIIFWFLMEAVPPAPSIVIINPASWKRKENKRDSEIWLDWIPNHPSHCCCLSLCMS